MSKDTLIIREFLFVCLQTAVAGNAAADVVPADVDLVPADADVL